MNMRSFGVCALSTGLALAPAALAGGVNTPEAEPNEVKSTATLTSTPMIPSDVVSGSSTGTFSGVGASSRDFFRLRIAASAPGIYLNRMTIITAPAHIGAIMGIPQSGAASDTTVAQTSTSKMNQWYSFGAQHDLYYRVTGATGTTDPYISGFTQDAVTPVNLGDSFEPGEFTFSTVGQGHFTDTEIILFDDEFNVLRMNDDRQSPASLQSQIVETLDLGDYYLAVSQYNLAISVPNETKGEASIFGNRLDFPGAIARETAGSNIDVSYAISHPGDDRIIVAMLPGPFDMHFAKFTVANPPCPADITGDGQVNSSDLGQLLASWGPGASVADLNGDQNVNSSDLGILLASWGPCPM